MALALFALLGAFSAAMALRQTSRAAAPNPAPGSAVVDGNSGEWDLTADFFANMWRAGDEFKENPVLESKLYLRYSCQDQTLYALVLAQPGVSIIADSEKDQESYVKLNNAKLVDGETGDDGVAPDFAFIGLSGGLATGWEASMSVVPGSYPADPANQNLGLNVHTQVSHDGSQTSAVQGRAISLNIECGDPTPTQTATETPTETPTATETPTETPTATETPT
ncbi:MAG TPA: hypothetical protein PKD75_01035, partial [Tepidiformaceae bacterium]|nr:hypothetical protein [Tepidiformaceae bacterium]